jgi:gamma-glutamylcyclotransferase (GGCT)/AIG2-like uncharacterized protein YtfP
MGFQPALPSPCRTPYKLETYAILLLAPDRTLSRINQMPCSDSFLAVYGSLRRRSLAKQSFFVLGGLQFYGYGILRGLLLIQNGYPGVLEQPGQVRVEIFRLQGEGILEELDRYEGYRPALGSRSLFYRKEVDLRQPEIRAWVYFLGREIPRGRVSARSSGVQEFRSYRRGRASR